MKINPVSSARVPSFREHYNSTVSSKTQESKISRTSSVNQPSRFSSSIKSNNSNSTGSNLKVNDQKKSGNVISRPLKERLVHLLALKPYKKLELHDRINREGIKEKDKNTIERTLKEISFLRDNAYHLKRYLWNDVQEDWPFYSEQEKTILKRRKPQNLTPPGSSDGASNGSNEENNTSSFQVLDKPSVSMNSITFNKSSFSDSNSSIYNNSTQHQRKQIPEQKQNCVMNGKRVDNRSEKSVNSDLPDFKMMDHEDIDKVAQKTFEVKASEQIRDSHAYQQNQHNRLDSAHQQYNSQPLDNTENGVTRNPPSTSSTPSSADEECTDYKTNYTTINSYEQRKRYKTEYSERLKEYKQLSTQIDVLNSKCRDLGEKWRRMKSCDDLRAQEIQDRIYMEYENSKDVRTRHKYLYEKLNHIKKLVVDYDNSIKQQ